MGDDRYQQLYEQSVTAILSADRNGVVVDCNQAACRLLARSRPELLDSPVLKWVAPRERRAAKQRFLSVFSNGIGEWQTRLLRPDGGTRAVVIRALAYGDEAAERIDALIWDTGRVSEAPLGEALRQVMENVPGQFALVLDETGRIRHARGTARTHWRNDSDLLGADMTSLVAGSRQSEEQLEAMAQAIAAGRPWSGRQLHRRADGSRFDVVLYAVPHSDVRSIGVRGALIVGRDVSEETLLRARAERAERLAHIGELVASIAHELQAPLDAMRSVLPFLVAGTPESGLCMELDRMAELIGKLDAFTSDRSPELQALSLRTVIEETIRQESPRLREVAAAVVNDVRSDLPEIPADRGHVARVVREVLRNAADAVAGLERREIRFEADVLPDRVALRVRDSGTGLPADRAARAFEPFYTTKSGHLGVGLALVRGIITAHCGRAIIEPAPQGDGTVVTLELPLRQQAPAVPFRAVPLVLRSLTVLVVDDDEAIRTVLRRVLERVGYVVRDAFSGRSALASLVTEGRPDLLITDLKMTGGTGYWLLDKLGREYPDLVARTVIVTGDPADATIAEVAAQTGCPVLRKPIEFSALLEVLDEVALRATATPRRRTADT